MSDQPDNQNINIESEANIVGSAVGGGNVTANNIAGGDINITNILPQPRPDAVSNLPAVNPNFTGRREILEQIAANFSGVTGPVEVTQAISGMGGVGKTQVALAYAHTHRDRYDIIWLLSADETTALDNSLRQLGMTLELKNVAAADVATLRTIVLSHLSTSAKDVLLIYDNADQMTPRALRLYLPANCHLLITSRRDDSQWRGLARPLTLGTFTVEEAAAFWQRRLERDDEDVDDLAALAQELGYLPLAMEQAAAFMDKRQKSAAAYLTQFKERRAALWAREKAPDNYHATVATTWQMAFDHAQTTPGAAELLSLCCFFAPDDIPLAEMVAQRDHLPPLLAEVLADEDACDDALAALSDYSLLWRTDGQLHMHRLVQTVARDQMEDEQAGQWVAAAVQVLYEAYNFDPHDMRTWAKCGQLLPHLTTTTNLAAEWEVENSQAAYLNNEAGFYLKQFGEYAAARPCFERALAIDEKSHTADHPAVAIRFNNLGQLLQTMGDYEGARPYLERALVISTKELGENHPIVATLNNNLGELLREIGDYEGARQYYYRALKISEKVLGSNHPDVARALNNLGLLLRLMGDYERARPYLERALVIYEKVLGVNHPTVAKPLNNLGNLLQAIGDYEGARPYYKRALAIRELALGFNHPDTAESLNNLGSLYYDEGDYTMALDYVKRAYTIFFNRLGPDHPDTQTVKSGLEIVRRQLENQS